VLTAHGVPDDYAATVAHCLVHADLRGVDTHGLCRLPIYLDRLRRKLINPNPTLKPVRVTPVEIDRQPAQAMGVDAAQIGVHEAMRDGRRVIVRHPVCG
jgi:LDH2 family malate/lactate/ureidoglycolate dehydrogenase